MQLVPQPCSLVYDVQIADAAENPVVLEIVRVPSPYGAGSVRMSGNYNCRSTDAARF